MSCPAQTARTEPRAGFSAIAIKRVRAFSKRLEKIIGRGSATPDTGGSKAKHF